MAAVNPITAKTLRTDYVRLGSDYLERHGLDDAKSVYMHKERRTLLIAIQRGDRRQPPEANDGIFRTAALRKFYRYEQRGKENNKNGGMRQTSQIRFFIVSETFDWSRNDYPTQDQILYDGRSDTLENLIRNVDIAGDRLFTVDTAVGEIFFIDSNLKPVTRRGYDPDADDDVGFTDSAYYEDDPDPGHSPRRVVEDEHFEFDQRERVRTRISRTPNRVKVVIGEGTDQQVIIVQASVDQVVKALKEHFSDDDDLKPPF